MYTCYFLSKIYLSTMRRHNMAAFVFCFLLHVMLSATSPRWCMPGYWGNNCDKPGGIHCVDSIERETGRCFRCSPGYWGDNCNLLCPETCEIECIYPHELYSQSADWSSNGCGSYCDRHSGQCRNCKDEHYLGDYCNISCTQGTCKTCPANCERCSSTGSSCYECLDGYWGANCSEQCPNNCDMCSKYTGECKWCQDGWWGKHCENACNAHKCALCNRDYGICETCDYGFWGINCEHRCASGCAENMCEKFTGKCKICTGMFWGESCNMSCIIDNCESMIGCSRKLGPSCFKCKAGKWGIRCSEDCSTNCSDVCNINSGKCLIKKEDNRPTTDMRQMKEGTDIKTVIGISIGSAVVVVLFGVIIVVLIFKVIGLRNGQSIQQNKRTTQDRHSATTSKAYTLSDEASMNIHDDEISRLNRELAEITQVEQRLKQIKAEDLRRKLNKKKQIVSKLQGENVSTDGLYELPVINTLGHEYESLRN